MPKTVDYHERERKIPKFQMVSTLVALFDAQQIALPKNARYHRLSLRGSGEADRLGHGRAPPHFWPDEVDFLSICRLISLYCRTSKNPARNRNRYCR